MTALLALLFSLIAPGAGHALTGNYVQAVLIGGLFALGKNALLPLSLRVLKITDLKRTLQFFYVCNWCYILLIFYAVVSAFWCGLQTHEMQFWRAVLCACAIILVQKNTRKKIIFTALCGREGIWELGHKTSSFPTEKK